MKTINKILLAVGILLAAFLVYYQLRFQHFKITTESMYGNFLIGDILLFDKKWDTIKTKDIVAFNTSFIDATVCSRVVGLPNDKIEIKDGSLLINKLPLQIDGVQFEYSILSSVALNEKQLIKRKLLLEPFTYKDIYGNYRAFLNDKNLPKIKEINGVGKVKKVLHPMSYQYLKSETTIFPNNKNYDWSRDNFGEITVPKMGVKIELNPINLPLYIQLIQQETEQSITEIEKFKSYVFKKDYYFMISDNRHNSVDSRYFGFVSKSDIIGVYKTKIYSKE